MNKLKVAIAIPTYNRLEKLKFALEKIESQELDGRFDLYCVISNIASNDGTSEFLNQLSSDKLNFVIWNKPEDNINLNWRRCAQAIPKDIDWVWLHGDDDFLVHPQVIKGLVDVLEQHIDKDVSLIHACQARRSQKTGKMIRANLFDLCNQIGYHEILGWMSSIIMRREKLVPALMRSTEPLTKGLTPDDLLKSKYSSYPHSASILEECIDDDALFIDMPWVEPQDDEQTEESLVRWAENHEGDRYFFVVDDIIDLYERGILERKLSPIFFRYLSYSLWDRYAVVLLESIINTGIISDFNKENWLRVRKMAEFFEQNRDKKIFIQWYDALHNSIVHYEKLHSETLNFKKNLFDQYVNSNSSVYPFQILQIDGNLIY